MHFWMSTICKLPWTLVELFENVDRNKTIHRDKKMSAAYFITLTFYLHFFSTKPFALFCQYNLAFKLFSAVPSSNHQQFGFSLLDPYYTKQKYLKRTIFYHSFNTATMNSFRINYSRQRSQLYINTSGLMRLTHACYS